MAPTFQLHVLPLHWPDMGFPYTMPNVWAQLAKIDLGEAVCAFDESDLRAYDWEHQEIWLTDAAILRLASTRTDRLLRDAVGTAFVVTLAGQRLYGGLFYPEVGAAAIRFPVIHALGEPIAFLRIRPALGHGWAADEPSLTAQRAAIANPALAAWLTQKELIRSIPAAKRPRDPWARQA